MPVALGTDGATNSFCVTWLPVSGATGYAITITPTQSQPPAAAIAFAVAASSNGILLPQAYLPPLRSNGVRCFSTPVAFDIVVKTADSVYVGGERWFGECSPIARTASGCSGPFVPGNNSSISRAEWLEGKPSCMTWVDGYTNETGFAIHLEYGPSGTKFDFIAPPNTIELILPPEAQQTFPGPNKDPMWTVDVLLDGGKRERVGGGAIAVM